MRRLVFIISLCVCFALSANGAGAENIARGVRVIVIDAGHGGPKFPGAHYRGIYEKDLNLKVALKLGALIERELPEVKVVYTRKTDKQFSESLTKDLQARADIANKAEGDLFFSIHTNAAPTATARGVETLIMGESPLEQRINDEVLFANNKEEFIDMSDQRTAAIVRAYISNLRFTYGEYSEAMARLLEKNYKQAGRYVRKTKPQLLKVLYATNMPGVLTEIGFMSNPEELRYMCSEKGQNEIAMGNVIGSNLFNLLVVLGCCGVIRPFAVQLRWDYAASVSVAVVLFLMIFRDHFLSRPEAIFLLVLFAAFIGLTIRDALANRTEEEEEIQVLSPLVSVVYIVGGLVAIVWGGNLVVDSAKAIALSFGLSQTLVGLTVVALGTSLPELVTSVVASRKGENGLALGNVIGSNIFNILMVLAASAAVHPIVVTGFAVIDTVSLIAASVITWILCRSKLRISRWEGLVMLAMYAGYLVYICVR